MLSVIIITKNEASHIRACLSSVEWADEIIVLDSGSTDATLAICQEFTDKVYSTDWPGFGVQKQRALEKASGDWVLSLDADEQISAELRAELETAMCKDSFNAYEIPRSSSYCGRVIRHGGWWPDYVLRLFKRESGRFTDNVVHERVVVDGDIGRLTSPLLHDAFVDLNEVLHKINSYSSLSAEQMFRDGKRSSLIKAVSKGIWTFIRTYLIKASFLDGQQGFMLAISNAEGAYYKYLKLLQLQQQKDSGIKS